ncbi:MAG: response regulator [Candidatus Brocadiaceae bacterium]|nr:response regulator [Candidatus Brocadiaceae bacterium]
MDKQKKILVVDDEPKICYLIEELLKQEGYLVDVCFSSIKAQELIKNDSYQMLITDLKMPGIDGLALIRKSKEHNPEIKTIMVTGYTTVETAVQSLRHGVDDFITKPFNIFELKKTVESILHTQQTPKENMQLLGDLKSKSTDSHIHKQELTENVYATGEQLKEANKKLVQSIKELDTINVISKAITSVLDIDELLDLCLAEINKKLNVRHSSIMLVDESRSELVVRASRGYRRSLVLGKTQKIDEGVAGRVVKDKKPLLVQDIKRDERFNRSDRADYETKSFVSVPLILRERVLGVINVIDKIADGDFCESDVNLLCTIADQVSIALENARLYKVLEENCFNMVKLLADSLEAKNRYTSGHSQRVSEYSSVIANIMGVSAKEKNTLFHAALLHDLGKIGISELVFNKPDKLDDTEYDTIKLHPVRGEEIIKPLGFLEMATRHIRGHHESFDGSGYPDGLGGKDLPLLTKIMTVADAFDAMTSERTYRPPRKTNEAMIELKRMSGKQFDPDVVDAFGSSEIIKMKSDFENFSPTNR